VPVSAGAGIPADDQGLTGGFGWGGMETPEQDSTVGAEMWERTKKGGYQLGQMMADAPGFVYDVAAVPQNFLADKLNMPGLRATSDTSGAMLGLEQNPVSGYFKDQSEISEQKIAKANPKYRQGVIDSFEKGDWSTGFRNLAGGILESLQPSMSVMLSGGTMGTAGTVGTGAALFGAGKQAEIEQHGSDLPEWQQTMVAANNGALEGLFETALGAGAMGKAFKNVITRSLKEGGEEAARAGGKRFLGDMWARMVAENPALAPLGEGFEELGTQISQNAVDKYSGYRPDIALTEGAGDAMLMGIGQGGMMAGGLYAAKSGVADPAPEPGKQTDMLNTGGDVPGGLSASTKPMAPEELAETIKAPGQTAPQKEQPVSTEQAPADLVGLEPEEIAELLEVNGVADDLVSDAGRSGAEAVQPTGTEAGPEQVVEQVPFEPFTDDELALMLDTRESTVLPGEPDFSFSHPSQEPISGISENNPQEVPSGQKGPETGSPDQAGAVVGQEPAGYGTVGYGQPGDNSNAVAGGGDAEAEPRTVPGYRGKNVAILHPGGEEQADYAVVEMADLVPSHVPEQGFQKNPDYTPVNERTYHSSPDEQGKVLDNAAGLDPRFLITESPDAVHGPPVVTRDGQVLGGNSRTMSTRLAYERHPERAEQYRQTISDKAEEYGVDPQAVQEMNQPVLVRMLRNRPDEQETARLVSAFNQDFKQAVNPDAEGVSKAKFVSDETFSIMSKGLENHKTLKEYLDSAGARPFLESMVKDGALEKSQMTRFMKEGQLTPEGKTHVQRIVRGRVFDDHDLIDQLAPDTVNKIDRALPGLVKILGRGGKWNVVPQMSQALRHYVRYKNSPEFPTLGSYFAQKEMFEAIPGKKDIWTQTLAYVLNGTKTTALSEGFHLFSRDAVATQKKTGMLPGMGEILPTVEKSRRYFKTDESAHLFKGVEDVGRPEKSLGDRRQETEKPEPPEPVEQKVSEPHPPQAGTATAADFMAEWDRQEAAEQETQPVTGTASVDTPPSNKVQQQAQAKKDSAKSHMKEAAGLLSQVNDILSKNVGLSVKDVSRDSEIDESLYQQIQPLLKQALDHVIAAGKDVAEYVTLARQMLKGPNGRKYFKRFIEEEFDAPGTADRMGKDRRDRETSDQLGEDDVPDTGTGPGRDNGAGGTETGRTGGPEQDDHQLSGSAPSGAGTNSDQRGSGTEPGTASGSARGSEPAGSSPAHDPRQAASAERTDRTDEAPARNPESGVGSLERSGGPGAEFEQKRQQQRDAESVTVTTGDLDNIKKTLPFLYPEQHQDVLKAENRFFGKQPEHPDPSARANRGILFTNGTGTGKTYTGLGIIKRQERQGRTNIIVVTPSDKKVKDWIQDGENLGLTMTQLESLQDAGEGVVVTTYANFGQNTALQSRDWDLFVFDESHKLSENKDGSKTLSWKQFEDLSFAGRPGINRVLEEFKEELRAKYPNRGLEVTDPYSLPGDLGDRVRARINELRNSRAVFLSASPFAYRKSVMYGDGFLFNTGREQPDNTSGYNAGNPEQQFLMSRFGYRMRYNKLTEPESSVDVALMEREFNSWLQSIGALSGRVLDMDADYSREFIDVPSELGSKIQAGLDSMSDHDTYPTLSGARYKAFDYHYTSLLLESLKVRAAVDRIRKHLDLGRKVVVFHSRNQGVAKHPFSLDRIMATAKVSGDEAKELRREFNAWARKHPDLAGLNLSSLQNVPEAMAGAFGDQAVFFNGTVPTATREQGVADFNDDTGRSRVFVVQIDAGKEGISLHDTTGKFPRVMLSLYLPIKPTDAIQSEGRIYRLGQKSDAVFEYPKTGLPLERHLFGSKVNERAGTAENLALGGLARDLRTAYREGYLNSISDDPGTHQGRGGKGADRTTQQATPFERAKSYYFGRQKRTAKNKSKEGIDYFATPEPLGFKMVEWLNLKPGDKVLEPSAGHGAIARFFPDTVQAIMVEPSGELSSQLSVVARGRIDRTRFEDLSQNNKFDGIAMNPPFGKGGKQAMEHLAKAFKHLRDGGRIVAIVPDGPAMARRLTAWHQSEDAQNAVLRGMFDLPPVTFERAGTRVATQVVILDKYKNPDQRAEMAYAANAEIQANDINELFNRIEGLSAPERVAPKAEANQAPADLKAFGLSLDQAKNDRGSFWLVTGNTYKHKEDLKRAGAKWNRTEKGWAFYQEESPAEKILSALPEPEPKYFRETPVPGAGIDTRDAEDVVDAIRSMLADDIEIEVKGSVDQLPAAIQDDMKVNDAEGSPGVFWKGTVYVVADNLESRDDLVKNVLGHELTHAGLAKMRARFRGLTGKAKKAATDIDRVLRQIWMAKTREIRKMAEEGGQYHGVFDLRTDKGRLGLTEEWLANHAKGTRWYDKFVAAVRRFLRAVGDAAGFKVEFSEAEVRDLLDQAGQAVMRSGEMEGEIAPAYSRRSKNNTTTSASSSLFPEVQARIDANRGVKAKRFLEKVQDWATHAKHVAFRHFVHLDPKKFGNVISILREAEAIPSTSQEWAAERMREILGDFSKEEYRIFSMRVILPDMLKDIDSGLLDETKIPFGYESRDQVVQDLEHFEAGSSELVNERLRTRDEIMEELRKDMVAHKVLPKDVLDDPRYFHHQVMQYMAATDYSGTGSKDARVRWKGWKTARKGSALDYNTDYLQAEFTIMSQGRADALRAEVLAEIRKVTDRSKRLKRDAKKTNRAQFYAVAGVLPHEIGTKADPLHPYAGKMAMYFSKLEKMAKDDTLVAPPEFEDVLGELEEISELRPEMEEAGLSSDEMHIQNPKLFAYLGWLAQGDHPGTGTARGIFKVIASREKLIKTTLGKQFKTLKDLVPEGYVIWSPMVKSPMFKAPTIPEKIMRQLLLGEKIEIGRGDVKEMWARGQKELWVIPEPVANQLDEPAQVETSSLGRADRAILNGWKQWTLLNPFRVLKYNLNNTSGDADIVMAYDPAIFKEVRQAASDLWKWTHGKELGSAARDELHDALSRDVIGSGLTVQEVPDVTAQMSEDRLLEDLFRDRKPSVMSRYWRTVKDFTTWRENVLRLAAYRHFKAKVQAGTLKDYAASIPEMIDDIKDPNRKAATLARELVGDYGNLSQAGMWIRRHMIPFWSWMEINLPRYVRLMRNLPNENQGRLAKIGGWKAGKKGAGLALKAFVLYGAVQLWNHLFFPDEEEELSRTGRNQVHLILGRRGDGSIRSIRFQGALTDALSWFGMENPVSTLKALYKDTMDGADVWEEFLKSAPNKLILSARPFARTGMEVLTGDQLYPDAFRARPVRDKVEHLARTFSMSGLVNWLEGKPKRGGSVFGQLARDIEGLLMYSTDPGESAYWDIRADMYKWLRRNGVETGASKPTSKGNALYWYKQSLRFGDLKGAERFWKQYRDLGGNRRSADRSIRMADPRRTPPGVKRRKMEEYKRQLSPARKKLMDQAVRWYKDVYADRKQ
jgi:protein-L-isoaspartate O-methyltransferase